MDEKQSVESKERNDIASLDICWSACRYAYCSSIFTTASRWNWSSYSRLEKDIPYQKWVR